MPIGYIEEPNQFSSKVTLKLLPTPNEYVKTGAGLCSTVNFPKYQHFPSFNPVQTEALNYVHNDNNLIIAAPTSVGKTTIGEFCIIKGIELGGKAIYLSPLKAVTTEKYSDWSEPNSVFSDFNLSIVTGDYILTAQREEELKKSNIILLTSEMLDSCTRTAHSSQKKWLLDVNTLIVDEAHLLGVESRGDKLECALARFASISPNARIIFLSATIPNAESLAEWLTKLNGKHTDLLISEWRPQPVESHWIPYHSTFSEEELFRNIVGKVKKLLPEKVLIFCHTKKHGKTLQQELERSGISSEFHNADLTKEKRHELEYAFKKKDSNLKVLLATTTLAWGVNLPARHVIICGLKRGISLLSPTDIHQMIGRAGRTGLDPKGDAWVYYPSQNPKLPEQYKIVPPTISQLDDAGKFGFHFVSEIFHRNVNTAEKLFAWYKTSLHAHQFPNKITISEVRNNVTFLKNIGAIEENNGILEAKHIGKVAANFYYNPLTIANLFHNFKALSVNNLWKNDDAVSYALANVTDNNGEASIKPYHRDLLTKVLKLFKVNPNMGANTSGGITIAYNVYSSKLRGVDSEYPSMQGMFLSDIARYLTVSKLLCFNAPDNFFETLELRFRYGVEDYLTPLVELKGIGAVYAKKLWSIGIKSKSDIINKRNEIINTLPQLKSVIENLVPGDLL